MRTLLTISGVATAATGIALLLQDRSLSRDLENAAIERLTHAATATRRLASIHVDALTERYRTAVGTPQFRAVAELHDAPTLEHMLENLRSRHGAARIAFADDTGELFAGAGDARLDGPARAAGGSGIFAHDGSAYAIASIPVTAADRTFGHLFVAQRLDAATFDAWSELCGAQVLAAPVGERGALDSVYRVADSFGSLELRVSSSLNAEQSALANSRWNLLIAGGLALATALIASLFLSRSFVRPIHELSRAAERIGAGDLTVRVETSRSDEIGDMARSFESMTARLRELVGRVATTADRVEETASRIATVSERLTHVTAEQVRGNQQAAASMDHVNEQVEGIAESASRSAEALDLAVDGSSRSFHELEQSGEALDLSALELLDKTAEIARSIDEMMESARRVTENTEALLPAAQQTAASMAKMEASAREVDSNAKGASELSSRTIDLAEQGGRKAAETVTGMDQISLATEGAQSAIRLLGERVDQIGAILTMISDVTDETALLSLNAAIIAAQAGESGRPFAVVADELKALAQRVAAGTGEISDLVSAIRSEGANAVAAIGQTSDIVRGGVSLVGEAGRSLAQITEAARETSERMMEIATATGGQTRTASEVVQAMEQVRDGVEAIRSAEVDQQRGNDVVQRGAVSLSKLAEHVKLTIVELRRGAARIGEKIDTVQGSVTSIYHGLQEQSQACLEAAKVFEASREHTRANEESAREMGDATRDLLGQAEALRVDLRRFTVQESDSRTRAMGRPGDAHPSTNGAR